MQPFPHHYGATAAAGVEGPVTLSTPGVPDLPSEPPVDFDGPGTRWSPETLLPAILADCFILTFRVVARLSKLQWTGVRCDAEGVVDRMDGVIRFGEVKLRVMLTVPEGVDHDRARRIVEKAEKGCLIARSMSFPVTLESEVLRD